jgi:uncharacterized protein with HEPN domain
MRDLRLFLDDIVDSVDHITKYTAQLDEAGWLGDDLTQDAVIRRLLVIGEAVRHLPEETRAAYPSIPWRDVAAMRNRLSHEYFGVEVRRVWRVVQRDLPELRRTAVRIINDLSQSG